MAFQRNHGLECRIASPSFASTEHFSSQRGIEHILRFLRCVPPETIHFIFALTDSVHSKLLLARHAGLLQSTTLVRMQRIGSVLVTSYAPHTGTGLVPTRIFPTNTSKARPWKLTRPPALIRTSPTLCFVTISARARRTSLLKPGTR